MTLCTRTRNCICTNHNTTSTQDMEGLTTHFKCKKNIVYSCFTSQYGLEDGFIASTHDTLLGPFNSFNMDVSTIRKFTKQEYPNSSIFFGKKIDFLIKINRDRDRRGGSPRRRQKAMRPC